MLPINVTALFCEDIRIEQGNTLSLIGVWTDHVQLEGGPMPTDTNKQQVMALPKLAIFVRIAFDPEHDIGVPSVLLTMPGDAPVKLGEVPIETVEKSRRESKEYGNLLAGVTFRAIAQNFPIPRPGVAKVEVQIGNEIHLAGAVNFSHPVASST